MTEAVPTTVTPETSAPSPAALSPELAYLKSAGEDISGLQSELESILGGNRDSNVVETPAPAPESPSNPDYRLGIDREGKPVQLPPQQPAPQQPVQQSQQQLTQEQALDPYRVDAPNQQTAPDVEPGEIVLGADDKIRDARTGRYVPHQALHAERLRLKETRTELETVKEQNARAQERLNVLTEIIQGQQAAQQQTQQPAPEPAEEQLIDPEIDVFGSVKQLIALNTKLQEKLAEVQQNSDARINKIQSLDRYQRDALTFTMQNPDFIDAYKHLNSHRANELTILGFPEQQIKQQLLAEEETIRNIAFSRPNGSPAQLIYDMAKARGYTPKAKEQPAPQPSQVAQAVAAPAQAQPAPQSVPSAQQAPQPASDAAAQIRNMQQGVTASATLTGAGGSDTGGLTVQQLADMSDEDFVNFATKFGPKKLDRLLGGRQ